MSGAMWTFAILMGLMTLSGGVSIVCKKKTPVDYLLASRDVKPWLTALSTVGTNNSGFMFIGMIAFTYQVGIETFWMMIGWLVGDFMGWIFIHPKVREESEKEGVNTLSALIGTRSKREARPVVIAAGIITFVFLSIYAAAQFKAGSTALHALFQWDMSVGVYIGAAIVLIYSYAGGIRADIWTDASQSVVMFVAITMILAAGYLVVGGPAALFANLKSQDPALIHLFPEELRLGLPLFILGFVFAGIGTIGQPHLMTRLMAIESVKAIKPACFYYFGWFIPFWTACIAVGLYTRTIIPELPDLAIAQGLRNPLELALPLVTMKLLPDVFVGLALAGLFAAAVSTADSQIIVCSGALTQDMNPRWKKSYLASKLATVGVTALAAGIALLVPESVFDLMLIAWSAMGASLGPLLVIRLLNMPMNTRTALSMMVCSITTVIIWHASGLDDDVLKILPGTVAAAIVYGIALLFPYRPAS